MTELDELQEVLDDLERLSSKLHLNDEASEEVEEAINHLRNAVDAVSEQ